MLDLLTRKGKNRIKSRTLLAQATFFIFERRKDNGK